MIHTQLQSQDLVATVQIVFRDMPTLVLSTGEWEKYGGYRKIIASFGICIRQILKVERTAMDLHDFASLEAWPC